MIYRFLLWLFGPDHRVYSEIVSTVVALALMALILGVAFGEIYMAAMER